MNANVPNSATASSRALPRTIPEYLAELRAALRGSDPALSSFWNLRRWLSVSATSVLITVTDVDCGMAMTSP